MDITETNRTADERFEINHHAYRLWRSQCYQASEGALGCISCHDPHVKPESAAFREQVGGVCGDCHTQTHLDAHHDESTAVDACVDCHMPTRRTQDVIEVTMTDHRIARGPFDHDALVAPRSQHEPDIVDTQPLPFGHPPEGIEAAIYRAASTVRTLAYPEAVNALKNLLVQQQPEPLGALPVIAAGTIADAAIGGSGKDCAFFAEQGLR